MKRINVIFFSLLGGFVAAQSQYQVSNGVFGNGGAVLSGIGYHLAGTLGQTLCGEMSSSTNTMGVGFWYMQHTLITSIVEKPEGQLPESYGLHQSYPNPFNPVCVIEYAVPEPSEVTILVYDMMGREAATLFRGVDAPGFHKVLFQPERLPSGLYFYRMTAKSLKTGKTYGEVKKATYVR